jgi:hypothetical protein
LSTEHINGLHGLHCSAACSECSGNSCLNASPILQMNEFEDGDIEDNLYIFHFSNYQLGMLFTNKCVSINKM